MAEFVIIYTKLLDGVNMLLKYVHTETNRLRAEAIKAGRKYPVFTFKEGFVWIGDDSSDDEEPEPEPVVIKRRPPIALIVVGLAIILRTFGFRRTTASSSPQ